LFKYFKQKIFSRLALLFFIATISLVFTTYYVLNWAIADKDNILDAHDAYYHTLLLDSWKDLEDTLAIRKELANLQLFAKIYFRDNDTLCINDQLYWQNSNHSFSACDYISLQDSKTLELIHGILVPGYVSFGDLYPPEDSFSSANSVFPATLIENEKWRVLLTLDYIYPSDFLTFLPVMFFSVLFISILYLLTRRFLFPISLMQRRILALEQGDLESKIEILGDDELALLSKNFNRLILEIKGLLGQKERLLSDVSHEIRTPLSKIRLLLAMEPSKEKIAKIDRQIDYLDSIVTNILISDKLSTPYSNLAIEKIAIKNLINQAVDLSKNKNVQVSMKADFVVCCDVIKMCVVIKNVLDNAAKYAPSKLPVIIRPKMIGDSVIIECSDSGPGIEEDLMKKLATPFARGKNLRKSGFGLGLSICKKVLASHFGDFSVINNDGAGCCFTIRWNNTKLMNQINDAKK
jgi:signal transduction histidine kinase